MQKVCQLSVSEIFKNKHCQAIVSFANEVEMAEEHLSNTFKIENSPMVNHIQSNYKQLVAEIIRWNEIMRGVYEFKPNEQPAV